MKPPSVTFESHVVGREARQLVGGCEFRTRGQPLCALKFSSVDLNATVKRDAATMTNDELMGLLSAEAG